MIILTFSDSVSRTIVGECAWLRVKDSFEMLSLLGVHMASMPRLHQLIIHKT